MSVTFGVLGQVEIRTNGQPGPVRGVKPKRLLAALLLSPNVMVTLDRLVDAVWPDDPPRSARENLRTYASEVRRSFADLDGHSTDLTTSRSGFLLTTPPDSVDLTRFTGGSSSAAAALKRGDGPAAVARFQEALSLWRGAAGEGLPRDGWLGMALEALDELRLRTAEDLTDACLTLGRHAELLPELLRRVAENPLRERSWRQLMLAQYRSGCPGEALGSFNRARQLIGDELGIEPGAELKELQHAILNRQESLAAPAAARESLILPADSVRPNRSMPPTPQRTANLVPRQLPAPVPRLVGRESPTRLVHEALRTADTTPAIITLTGPPGIGTSAMAIHAAHAASDLFPDGQLYLDLSRTGEPTHPTDCLGVVHSMLRALHEHVSPTDCLADATNRLRSTLAVRRVLVVVDNASSEADLAPLLPAHRGSAAIIAGSRMLAVDGITRSISLGPLAPAEGLELLEIVAGSARVRAETEVAREVVALCGGSPLAIKLVGMRLASRPRWTLKVIHDRLGSAASLLDELSFGELSVRDSISRTVRILRATQSRAADLLAQLAVPSPGSDGHPSCAFDLSDERRYHLADLDALADLHLLEHLPAGRFRVPEFVRTYLRDTQHARPPVEHVGIHTTKTGIPVQLARSLAAPGTSAARA